MNKFLFFVCGILTVVAGLAFAAATQARKELHEVYQKDTSGLCLDYLKLDSAKYWNGKYNEVE